MTLNDLRPLVPGRRHLFMRNFTFVLFQSNALFLTERLHADEPEHCRKKCDGSDHGEDDGHHGCSSKTIEKIDAEKKQTQQSDANSNAGEHNSAARGVDSRYCRL